jgi:alkyl hydroperoxide reductase subunit D
MSLDALREALPGYAKDLNLNLGTLSTDATLNTDQIWGTFLACAHAIGTPAVVKAFEAEAAARLSPEVAEGARAAAAIMGMNNIYYRFLHLAHNGAEYQTLRAGLRMNIIANPGMNKADFELFALAVSAINGCGMCVDSHEKVLREHGYSTTQIQAAVKIAAVVHAVSRILAAEAARV